MGVAAADYDNDGHTDIYITGYPAGALYTQAAWVETHPKESQALADATGGREQLASAI